MDDEVYKPLGYPPRRTARPADRRPRGARFSVALAILALVVSCFSLVRREAHDPVTTVKAAAAQMPYAPPDIVAQSSLHSEQSPTPPSTVAEPPSPPPIASADPAEAASGAKIPRKA